ncbi:Protein CBG27543 [Caenorhabditis briggsae]|uniref:Protein CBG27543 n=2 Tax=Caenorhabditis briggsae TaxID=6238 RepID=B6IKK4_CAEBR|nr:Protein CBG27543 [Caenorhabditis briggsae]ULT81030.1 hypothetical protein L3Y34_011120 [Caenorhabditis briggsae]CAS00434.1 Protein CBG27543 [Caenorhabditis briggsae]
MPKLMKLFRGMFCIKKQQPRMTGHLYGILLAEELRLQREAEEEEEERKQTETDSPTPDTQHLLAGLNEEQFSELCFKSLVWKWSKMNEIFTNEHFSFHGEMLTAGLECNQETEDHIIAIIDAAIEGYQYTKYVRSAEEEALPIAPLAEAINAFYECRWFVEELRENIRNKNWQAQFVRKSRKNQNSEA